MVHPEHMVLCDPDPLGEGVGHIAVAQVHHLVPLIRHGHGGKVDGEGHVGLVAGTLFVGVHFVAGVDVEPSAGFGEVHGALVKGDIGVGTPDHAVIHLVPVLVIAAQPQNLLFIVIIGVCHTEQQVIKDFAGIAAAVEQGIHGDRLTCRDHIVSAHGFGPQQVKAAVKPSDHNALLLRQPDHVPAAVGIRVKGRGAGRIPDPIVVGLAQVGHGQRQLHQGRIGGIGFRHRHGAAAQQCAVGGSGVNRRGTGLQAPGIASPGQLHNGRVLRSPADHHASGVGVRAALQQGNAPQRESEVGFVKGEIRRVHDCFQIIAPAVSGQFHICQRTGPVILTAPVEQDHALLAFPEGVPGIGGNRAQEGELFQPPEGASEHVHALRHHQFPQRRTFPEAAGVQHHKGIGHGNFTQISAAPEGKFTDTGDSVLHHQGVDFIGISRPGGAFLLRVRPPEELFACKPEIFGDRSLTGNR